MKFFNKNNDNGFNKETAACNLYGQETQKRKQEEQKRNELLNNLGDSFEPKHIFASNEKLEKLANNNLKAGISTSPQLEELKSRYSSNIQAARNFEEQKLKNNYKQADEIRIKNSLKPEDTPKFREDLYGKEVKKEFGRERFEKDVNIYKTRINQAGAVGLNKFARFKYGPDTLNMLNLAQSAKPIIYTKDAVKLTNTNDKQMADFNNGEINKFKPYIENKVKEQFKDFGYNLEDVNGYIFKSNSSQVKRIKQSDDFKDTIAKNIHNVADEKSFSGRYQGGNKKKDNLHNAYGSVDFLNAGYDKNGNLKLYMFDTYDFNKGENPKVEAGRRMMQEGKLKGYYSLHEITLTKDELDDIMKNAKYDK